MKKLYFKYLLILMIFLAIGAGESKATVMVKFSTADLTRRADNIVIGKVVEKHSAWNDDLTRIYTYATIEVERDIKGNSSKEITIREIGGIVGDIGQKIIGSAEYNVNENVVIFLKKDDENFRTIGMMQGKFNIIEEANGTKKVVNQAQKGLMLMREDGTEADAETRGAIEFNEFIELIISSLN